MKNKHLGSERTLFFINFLFYCDIDYLEHLVKVEVYINFLEFNFLNVQYIYNSKRKKNKSYAVKIVFHVP